MPTASSHVPLSSLFLLIIPPPPRSTLFPYTTLFRSLHHLLTGRRYPSVQCLPHRPASGSDNGRGIAIHQTRSEEHTSELQSRFDLVCRLLLEKKKYKQVNHIRISVSVNALCRADPDA